MSKVEKPSLLYLKYGSSLCVKQKCQGQSFSRTCVLSAGVTRDYPVHGERVFKPRACPPSPRTCNKDWFRWLLGQRFGDSCSRRGDVAFILYFFFLLFGKALGSHDEAYTHVRAFTPGTPKQLAMLLPGAGRMLLRSSTPTTEGGGSWMSWPCSSFKFLPKLGGRVLNRKLLV